LKVTPIGITRPLGEYEKLSPEEFIIAQARISNPDNKLNTETMPGLLRFLIQNKHWSPFDLVSVNFEIETRRSIGTQLLRHWNIDWQEYSQRYSEVKGIEPIELRKQGKTNRQVGDEEFDPIIKWRGKERDASDLIEDYLAFGKVLYDELVLAGVAKECARDIMPLASSTTLIGHGTIRSWMSVLNQRLEHHAQKEIRDVASEVADHLIIMFPNLAKATNYFNDKKGNFM
jgi:thymidylate synthase (FAD)